MSILTYRHVKEATCFEVPSKVQSEGNLASPPIAWTAGKRIPCHEHSVSYFRKVTQQFNMGRRRLAVIGGACQTSRRPRTSTLEYARKFLAQTPPITRVVERCAVSSVVEHHLDTVGVTGSKPVSRTISPSLSYTPSNRLCGRPGYLPAATRSIVGTSTVRPDDLPIDDREMPALYSQNGARHYRQPSNRLGLEGKIGVSAGWKPAMEFGHFSP